MSQPRCSFISSGSMSARDGMARPFRLLSQYDLRNASVGLASARGSISDPTFLILRAMHSGILSRATLPARAPVPPAITAYGGAGSHPLGKERGDRREGD